MAFNTIVLIFSKVRGRRACFDLNHGCVWTQVDSQSWTPGRSRAPPAASIRWISGHWDVFICHAGEDKQFGLCLHQRLLQHGLRSFLDKESLFVGTVVPQSLEYAVKSTQIAVVLLSEVFFLKKWPQD